MAEYIEREALLSELQEEIDFETSMYTDEQNKYFNMGLKCAVRDVKSQPTADVVPKSEVEELKAIIADHKANEEQWQELYADTVDKWEKAYEELEIKLENAKAEVAREIFEEIERFLYLHFRFCKEEIGNDDTEYVKCRMELNTQIQNFIAELKKKYI